MAPKASKAPLYEELSELVGITFTPSNFPMREPGTLEAFVDKMKKHKDNKFPAGNNRPPPPKIPATADKEALAAYITETTSISIPCSPSIPYPKLEAIADYLTK